MPGQRGGMVGRFFVVLRGKSFGVDEEECFGAWRIFGGSGCCGFIKKASRRDVG
jgi:hypothetical protein